ncbi:hypothetical protein KQI58_12720 [Enterococcus raffinosus]|uniref:hypothetical protein n=1 Tax=Enterococcus raffinosus TaxID=71452 RepID=UPI001C109162|nr:hypothetical protein [Enterococcus raffinosus]MBU5361935.1 hypothetical protein [Enterococcus raffinosus]
MKKSMLYTGFVYFFVGIISLVIALTTAYPLEALLWGITGAGIATGIRLLGKYYYWTKPEHKAEYDARLQNEAIQLKDERKVMLRDKSGRLAYIAMMLLQLILTFIFSILSMLEYFYPFSRYACIGMSILLIIQYVFGIVAYRRLSKSL